MNGLNIRRFNFSFTFGPCLGVALLLLLAQPSSADQTTLTGAPHHDGIFAKARRKLSRISRPAEFTGAGLLQFEYGYDGDFEAPDAERDQAGTASLLFNATEDLQLEFDFDTFQALTDDFDRTTVGIGDAYASAQATALSETQRYPSLAFAYLVKIPTASTSKELGTGRPDHKLQLLASKKVWAADVDFNASLLVNGVSGTHEWDTGYQLALGFSHGLTRSWSLQAEIFGETLDTDQPRGMFVQSGLTYQPTFFASFDLGARAGLTSSAPRFGVLGGVSFSVADLYGGGAGE